TGAVSEVAGIAVRSPYRRQGLAGAITAAITRRLFTTGVEIAWLEASGEKSWRVYERVGYRPAGQRLYIAMD
ncbi:GNAT family N-acetyltransferase, partial [Micromonospora sp. 4G55]